jgi:histone H3/H4
MRPIEKPPRRKHKFHPGTVARRQVRKEQKSTKALIPFALFARMVRNSTTEAVRWNRNALLALREAMESYLVEQATTARLVMKVNNTRTLTTDDLALVATIRRRAGHKFVC